MISNLIFKIFIFVFLGFCFGKMKKLDLELFTQIIIDSFIYGVFPIFILLVIWKNQSSLSLAINIFFIALGVVLGGAFFSLLFSAFLKKPFREISLPIMFMNSGYLAIPVNTLFFGEKGCEYAVIYDIVIGLMMYTLGIFLISGKRNFRQVFRMPIIYAAALGMFLNYINISIPGYIQNSYNILKIVIFPFILALVGYQLSLVKFHVSLFRITGIGMILRMGGGGFIVWSLNKLFHLSTDLFPVVLLSSIMPSAVTTYILAKKYHNAPDYAASMVIFSTLLSIIVIPLVGSLF